jgi:hypothetical protein
MLEDHLIRYSSKRLEPNTFEISVRDPSGQISRVIRVSAGLNTLTMLWSGGDSKELRKLVYARSMEGPILEAGKTGRSSQVVTYSVAQRTREFVELAMGWP